MTRPGTVVPADPDADAPEWWRRAGKLNRVPLIALIFLAAILFHSLQKPPAPALTTSCTTPAIALSTATAQQHHAVHWSATGPSGTIFQLTVGVKRFDTGADGKLKLVPEGGHPATAVQSASRPTTMPGSCKTSGTFGVIVPPGHYTVTMFTLNDPHHPTSATRVATKPLAVQT